MSTDIAGWRNHTLTIIPDATVGLLCFADAFAPCRRHPTQFDDDGWRVVDCQCVDLAPCTDHLACGLTETSLLHDNAGHTFTPGRRCWVEMAFEEGRDSYIGQEPLPTPEPWEPVIEVLVDVVGVDDDIVLWRIHDKSVQTPFDETRPA